MKTVDELKQKIREFTCTEEEAILSDDELCCYINMAVEKVQKVISSLNKDYFTSCEDVAVEACQQKIDLPEDIMGTKIKAVLWDDGKSSKCCPLTKGSWECLCDEKKGDPCNWVFFNKKDEGNKLYLQPIPKSPGTIKIIYERSPDTVEAGEDLPNPECCAFYFSFLKKMIYEKEKNPMINLAIAEMNESMELIIELYSEQFGGEIDCQMEADPQWTGYVDEYAC